MSSPDRGPAPPSPEEIEDGGDLLADVAVENAALRAWAKKILEQPEDHQLSEAEMQEAITAMIRLYTVRFQVGERWSPFVDDREMPATAAMIMCTAMLRAVNIELFELGMWQAWSGA